MPKFLYSIIVVTLLAWFLWIQHLFFEEPDSTLSILVFFVELYIGICGTLSLIIFYKLHKKAPTFSNLRHLYRRSLRTSAVFSTILIGYLIMRAFEIDTWVNTLMYFAIAILVINKLKNLSNK